MEAQARKLALNEKHELAAKTAAKAARDMALEIESRTKERDQLALECDDLSQKLAAAQAQLRSQAALTNTNDFSDLEQRVLLLQRRHAALAQQLDARTKERNDDAKKLVLITRQRDSLAARLGDVESHMNA